MRDNKWADINRAGSGATPPKDSDNAPDAQEAIDRANNCSRLHQQANELADRSGK